MGYLSDFPRGQIAGARLAGASISKMAVSLSVSRATVPNVMTVNTYGKTPSVIVAENQNQVKGIAVH
jgi:hypothetical protein